MARWFLPPVLCSLFLMVPPTYSDDRQPPSQAGPRPGGAESIRKLVERLDSDKFAERDKAMKDLEALGPDALPVLREVLKSSWSLEVVRRLDSLVQKTREPGTCGEGTGAGTCAFECQQYHSQ